MPQPEAAERLQSELADLQSNHDLLELFLRDSEGDARVPVSLVRALSSRASQIQTRIEALRQEVDRRLV